MSVLNYIVEKLKSGIITFINAVTLANHDLPYHDYAAFTHLTTATSYAVGNNNVNAHGSQSKRFVSKSTLIFATENQTVRFNDANNVGVAINANVWYTFISNIYQVFFVQPNTDKTIQFWFEGVLPEEARSAE